MKIGVTLDDEAWSAQLAKAEAAARNMAPAFLIIREKMEQRIRDTFRQQRDPWGDAWAGWKHPDEIVKSRRKRDNYSTNILLDEGDLFGSIRGESDANSATITAGEDGPSAAYAVPHQYGDEVQEQRAYMPLRSPDDDTLPAEWYDDCVLPLNDLLLDAFL